MILLVDLTKSGLACPTAVVRRAGPAVAVIRICPAGAVISYSLVSLNKPGAGIFNLEKETTIYFKK